MAKTTKKPAGKPEAEEAPVESPFSPEFVEQQRQILHTERARYVKSADALKAEADLLANEREPGDVQFDEESGEGDTLAVERERDLALSAQARAAVDLIDAALARIEKGTYGICLHSGLPIPQERLEAIPWAAERVEFKAGSFRS
jgi:RNA polymerase-binding transcription factor DksA